MNRRQMTENAEAAKRAAELARANGLTKTAAFHGRIASIYSQLAAGKKPREVRAKGGDR